jgi:molybdenum cofactor synthesis domain-containing protein
VTQLRRALVITVSTRASRGEWDDRSGPVLRDGIAAWGLDVDGPLVVADGDAVEAALRDSVASAYDLVVTTGGTGLTPTDLTPEMTARVIDREIPGIAEAVRAAGVAKGVPTAILSRGLAGTAGRTLVINLPGSTGGVRDALETLADVVPHALDQIPGSDHPRTD